VPKKESSSTANFSSENFINAKKNFSCLLMEA
jgi:hypothetical protein